MYIDRRFISPAPPPPVFWVRTLGAARIVTEYGDTVDLYIKSHASTAVTFLTADDARKLASLLILAANESEGTK